MVQIGGEPFLRWATPDQCTVNQVNTRGLCDKWAPSYHYMFDTFKPNKCREPLVGMEVLVSRSCVCLSLCPAADWARVHCIGADREQDA